MLVVINNLPLARSEQPEYQAQEGGFAAAVGPGYGKEVTSVYGKIYIISLLSRTKLTSQSDNNGRTPS